MKTRPRILLPLATAALVAMTGVAMIATRDAPAWVMMGATAAAIFFGCKLVTLAGTTTTHAPRTRVAAYLFAWPGLDADAFLTPSPAPVAAPVATPFTAPVPTPSHAHASMLMFLRTLACRYGHAIATTVVGAMLVVFAAYRVGASTGDVTGGTGGRDGWGVAWAGAGYAWEATSEWVAGWVGMVGMILVLHFGLFAVLAEAWRAAGVDVRPLMDRPLAARSVGEFWGRRWNTAFRDITHRYLFTPLAGVLGARWAIVVGFFASGLVHELVITIPARGGYGLPTLFFTWQGVAMLLERTRPMRRVRGHVWTLACLVPAFVILFPPVFVERVIMPMLLAIRQLLI